MSRWNISILARLILLVLFCGPARALEVGDGSDDDPTTFSFHSDNRMTPLVDEKGQPLSHERVASDYGTYYTILAGALDVCSVEYAWSLGIGGDQPRLLPLWMDLTRWETVRVENGWVGIDPLTGRFKFASENSLGDTRRLRHVRSLTLGNLTCWQIEVRDAFTFMPTEEETHGLLVMDAREPERPRYAGYCPMGGYAMRVQLLRDHAYTFESRQFSIADIRNVRGHEVRYVKTVPTPFGGDTKCAWDEKRKMLHVRKGDKMLVYDVADEDDPVLLRQSLLPGYGIAVEGRYGFLAGSYEIQDGAAPGGKAARTQLRSYRIRRDGAWDFAGQVDLEGSHGFWGGVDRGLLVRDGLAVTSTTSGLFLVDVSDPRELRLLKKIEELRLQGAGGYFGGGSGAKDYDLGDDRLCVATGGSVVVYDLSDRQSPRELARLEGEMLGGHGADFIRCEKGFLYVGQIHNGLLVIDGRDLAKPRRLGSLSAFGEVEYAAPVGDLLYAVSSGLYTLRRYPAEKAELLGYVSTHSHMFGGGLCSNPFPRENPRRIVFLDSSGNMRKVKAEDPSHPEMLTPHPPGGVARGQWIHQHLFVPNGALEVYRVGREGDLEKIASLPLEPGISRLVVRGSYAYGVHFDRGNHVRDILHVIDISDPARPQPVGKAKGPVDVGSMHSWTIGLFGDFLYLSGWQAGGGWGNFPGIRVYDVSDPGQPRPHTLIHHIPEDISVNSLASPQSFYVSGQTLYVADYWTGLHVFDITGLKVRREARHIATVKDPFEPWSGNSYCTSVAGHGRYLYTTNFGRVDIWEIPAPSDVPDGKITWMGAWGDKLEKTF